MQTLTNTTFAFDALRLAVGREFSICFQQVPKLTFVILIILNEGWDCALDVGTR